MRRLRAPEPTPVLEEEAWEVPDRLADEEFRGFFPPDVRREVPHGEDEGW